MLSSASYHSRASHRDTDYRDFRANFTVTLCCEVNSGRKWEFQYQRGIANGTYFHSCTARTRARERACSGLGTHADGAQRVARARVDDVWSSGARAWSSCVWGGAALAGAV